MWGHLAAKRERDHARAYRKGSDIKIQNPVHRLAHPTHHRIQSIVLAAPNLEQSI